MKFINICTFCMVFFLFQISCGGARRAARNMDECNRKATEILERDTVCDPKKIDTFEIEITIWQNKCEAKAQPLTKNLIDQRRVNSVKCAKETSLFENKRLSCKKQVEEIQAKKACEGESCSELLTSLKNVISDCQSIGEEGTALSDARRLQTEIEAKIKEVALNVEIRTLAMSCEKSKGLSSQDQKTDETLTSLVLALANPIIQNQIDKGATDNQAASEALSICKDALEKTIGAHVNALAKELRKTNSKRNPEKWMSYFRNLEGTLDRLREVGVPKILPNATAEIEKLLLEFDKQSNVLDSKSIDRNGLKVKKALSGGAASCRQLKADIERFEAKIAEHSRSGNDKKVKAYTKKRIQTEQALEAFEANIKKSIDSESLPEDEMARLVKDLNKAGCLTAAPTE